MFTNRQIATHTALCSEHIMMKSTMEMDMERGRQQNIAFVRSAATAKELDTLPRCFVQ
jgi:hypothetical protein